MERDNCEPYVIVVGRPMTELAETIRANDTFRMELPETKQWVIVGSKDFIKAIKELGAQS